MMIAVISSPDVSPRPSFPPVARIRLSRLSFAVVHPPSPSMRRTIVSSSVPIPVHHRERVPPAFLPATNGHTPLIVDPVTPSLLDCSDVANTSQSTIRRHHRLEQGITNTNDDAEAVPNKGRPELARKSNFGCISAEKATRARLDLPG